MTFPLRAAQNNLSLLLPHNLCQLFQRSFPNLPYRLKPLQQLTRGLASNSWQRLELRLNARLAALRAVKGDGKTMGFVADALQEEKRSEEHTSELQSRENLVCRLL